MLAAMSTDSLIAIFWYTLIFELPRYVIPIFAAALVLRTRQNDWRPAPAASPDLPPKVSVILVGHNEEDALETCVRSLREQSFSNFEIVIVSDGSTDGMNRVARSLVKRGLADRMFATDLRGGKSSGINLAWRMSTGDIIVNVDCDCSFDRYAIEHIVRAFDDPRVGCACGDVTPRNAHASIISQIQVIEYLQSISVGKRLTAAVDQVTCASGAFSAFRRPALESIGGFDVGGGEDLDTTLRMRQKGWRIAYAAEAICFTDVPTTAFQYIRQRLRWERDAIWIRYRKHARTMNPFAPGFRLAEAFHQWDFLLFNVGGAVLFPIYIIWLAVMYGAFAPVILIAMQVGLFGLDVIILAIAAWTTGRRVFWSNLPFLPAYAAFTTYVMRPVRLLAYLDEWAFAGSRRDNYTPVKVRLERPW